MSVSPALAGAIWSSASYSSVQLPPGCEQKSVFIEKLIQWYICRCESGDTEEEIIDHFNFDPALEVVFFIPAAPCPCFH